MAGKGTDRKAKSKDIKSVVLDQVDTLATFTLPDSLPCSNIEFPVILRKTQGADWNQILKESDEAFQEIEEYIQSKQKRTPKTCFLKTECDYIRENVFVHLIPALEETLNKAKLWEALIRQKCFFNGLDHISQSKLLHEDDALSRLIENIPQVPTWTVGSTCLNKVLWNNNPRYPGRKDNNLHLFNMPWVREHLKMHPRPYYPKSWLWPEEYAATLIQKTVRQYFVQRDDEVQEMRDFWKKLKIEKNIHDIEMNPFLARKFASTQSVCKNHQ